MSIEAIKEALDYLENNPTEDEAQDARRRARAQTAELEKAARTLAVSGWLAVIEEEPGITKAEREAVSVLKSIAKEAP